MTNKNQSEVKVTYTYRDKSRGSLHFTSEKQESPDLEPWNEYVLKSDYDKLKEENEKRIERIEVYGGLEGHAMDLLYSWDRSES